jgi:uncharacterized protein
MARLIVLIVLVVFAAWWIRRAWRRLGGEAPPRVKGGELVPCAHCGVHLPRAEAREVGGALFCSEEHARLGGR